MKKESKIVLAEKDVNDCVNKKINLEELAQRAGCSRTASPFLLVSH